MNSKLSAKLKFIAGILLMILNAGIWINGLFIHRERAMEIVWAMPLLLIGAFLLTGWYKTTGISQIKKSQKWKFTLSVLLVNYLVLYLIYMISDIIFWTAIDLLSIPGILLPLLLGIFIMGFMLSWKYEMYAGLFFLLWYFLILFAQIRYSEILHRGPYILLGITILIHGILYLYYYTRIKPTE
ncbi:MAG: hypothetical protein A2V46_11825 [Bacteroidetes bacterium RBG_19FT_COMBO_42_7]|jgi:uncharacterized membrane protein|nr:MAG: hypothetical protein A2V46_11825 [Bacteroidetes bacterium RBG_19FT_COMBO_42_7]